MATMAEENTLISHFQPILSNVLCFSAKCGEFISTPGAERPLLLEMRVTDFAWLGIYAIEFKKRRVESGAPAHPSRDKWSGQWASASIGHGLPSR
jgi:hypothetical protein